MGTICSLTFEEYIEKIKEFHGGIAPGMAIAGFMVDLALRNLPPDILADVICETSACLPDSVQILTPCSVGNQWMKVIDIGRFAMTFYDKQTGEGVRIYLDIGRLERWPAIKEWFLKLKPKKEQDMDVLLAQIKEAGDSIFGMEKLTVSPGFLKKKQTKKTVAVCPVCNEAYRAEDGAVCPACKQKERLPYVGESERIKTG